MAVLRPTTAPKTMADTTRSAAAKTGRKRRREAGRTRRRQKRGQDRRGHNTKPDLRGRRQAGKPGGGGRGKGREGKGRRTATGSRDAQSTDWERSPQRLRTALNIAGMAAHDSRSVEVARATERGRGGSSAEARSSSLAEERMAFGKLRQESYGREMMNAIEWAEARGKRGSAEEGAGGGAWPRSARRHVQASVARAGRRTKPLRRAARSSRTLTTCRSPRVQRMAPRADTTRLM